jgi:hypothetical protein
MSLPSLPLCVQLGDTVSGRYRLTRVLGAGRTGIVVGATRLPVEGRVAIHFMSPRIQQGSAPRRLLVDAGAASRTLGEHTRVIDAGLLQDGTEYVVVPDLEQGELQSLLSTGAMASPGDVERGRERARLRLQHLRNRAARAASARPSTMHFVLPRSGLAASTAS